MKNPLISLNILIICLLNACKPVNKFLETGIWRGALINETGVEIPFNFEVRDSLGKYTIYILNASERFEVNEITFKDDSIHIQMPLFDSEINGIFDDGIIKGVWVKHLADKSVAMDFYAKAGTNWRIKESTIQPSVNVSGKWKTLFISNDGKDTTEAIGKFSQNKARVTGTFLTTTGDFRFLDGVVNGKQLSLSTFDGSHAYLFTAEVNTDSTLANGKFYSGFSQVENFTAVKNDTAQLADAYSFTYLQPGKSKIAFSFPNLDKKQVSFSDARFKNKVVILQLMGSWCPNCMDEAAYLSKYYDKNKSKGIEILGLAYERTKDFNQSKKNIERFKKRFDIKYDLLITGYTNTEAAKSLPMLNKIVAFPTMIIIDKSGTVKKIHTGFNGPATGIHFTEWITEFEGLIDKLVQQ